MTDELDMTAEVDQLSTAFRDLTPAQALALIGSLLFQIHRTVQPLTDLEPDSELSRVLIGIGTKIDTLSSIGGLAAGEQHLDYTDLRGVVDEIEKVAGRVVVKGRAS